MDEATRAHRGVAVAPDLVVVVEIDGVRHTVEHRAAVLIGLIVARARVLNATTYGSATFQFGPCTVTPLWNEQAAPVRFRGGGVGDER